MKIMTAEKDLDQQTCFGQPRRTWDVRYFRAARKFLNSVGKIQFYILASSVILNFILIIYAGCFITHTIPFVSDGSMFSCQVPHYPMNRQRHE